MHIGGVDGLGRVWQPSRFKRAYASRGETSIPYLAPHDAFQYLPDDNERLSLTRTKNLDRYRVHRGQILQTCSGRNLGPNILVDEYLARFATSHDVIRIEIDDERMRHYAIGFLRSRTGQGLLRRDKSGSVIDHITVGDIETQELPLFDDALIDQIANLVRESFQLVEQARLTLEGCLDAFEASLPAPQRVAQAKRGWTVNATQLKGRLDAASYDPWIANVRDEMVARGGRPISELAEVQKPPGRYKTIYVDEGHGRPFMSGTQILQLVPAKQQFMAERAFGEVSRYELQQGWTVFMADGRAEKGLGVVAMVPADRSGWLASGHVGRLVPRSGTDPGWLWLAARSWHTQVQLKALASGSVVDATYPADIESVILPPEHGVDGATVTDAWNKFADGRMAEARAIALVEEAFETIGGDDSKGAACPALGSELVI